MNWLVSQKDIKTLNKIFKNMNNIGIISLLIAVILGSLAQVLLKKSGFDFGQPTMNWQYLVSLVKAVFSNIYFLSWALLGGLSIVFWIIAVSKLELSFVMPMVLALSIVLTVILANVIIGESISWIRWIGIIIIIIGLFFITQK